MAKWLFGEYITFIRNVFFLGSAGSNPLGGYSKDKDLGLDEPYLTTN